MSNLITAVEFAAFRHVNKKLNEGKINEAIELAQNSDLLKILGEFYFDVELNALEANYQDLMNGSSFVYLDELYKHKGVKAMLADYTYSRWTKSGNVEMTSFGIISKTSQDSQDVDPSIINSISKQAKVDAGIKFEYIEKYIMSDPGLFSRYSKNKRTKNISSFNEPKFYSL